VGNLILFVDIFLGSRRRKFDDFAGIFQEGYEGNLISITVHS
jgi:hypothetical protein